MSTTLCPRCSGSGKSPLRFGEPCYVCGGTGVYRPARFVDAPFMMRSDLVSVLAGLEDDDESEPDALTIEERPKIAEAPRQKRVPERKIIPKPITVSGPPCLRCGRNTSKSNRSGICLRCVRHCVQCGKPREMAATVGLCQSCAAAAREAKKRARTQT